MPSFGKQFEEDFMDSAKPFEESGVLTIDRLPDPMAGFKGMANTCDFIVYRNPHIYFMELKSYEGKSIPFDALRDNQYTGLNTKAKVFGVYAGAILNFRLKDAEHALFVPIQSIFYLKNLEERKSITLEQALQHGVRMYGTKKRTRYLYDIPKLLDEIRWKY